MSQRLDYMDAAPDAFQAVLRLETHVAQKSGLDPVAQHVVKLRASQINGCAFCVDMHIKECRALGLSEQWIGLIAVWREAHVFSAQERALLAFTEAVTRLGEEGVPDDIYDAALEWFSEPQLVEIVVAIGMINLWNRLAVSFRTQHPLDNAA